MPLSNSLLVNKGFKSAPKHIFFAKVTRVNVFTNTVDVVTIDDNASIYNCQICCSMPAGYNFGTRYMPTFQENSETQYKMSAGDIYCVAAYAGDYQNTVVLGFLFPRQTELSIPEYGLYVFRHESDITVIMRGDGTMEFYHPSGSYIKIGKDDTDVITSSISSGGLYPSSAGGFTVRDASKFPATMGMFIKFWAGQNITLDKDGNIQLDTGISKIKMTGGQINIESYVKTDNHVEVGTGATGVFATLSGQIVTVANGIIVSIAPV